MKMHMFLKRDSVLTKTRVPQVEGMDGMAEEARTIPILVVEVLVVGVLLRATITLMHGDLVTKPETNLHPKKVITVGAQQQLLH